MSMSLGPVHRPCDYVCLRCWFNWSLWDHTIQSMMTNPPNENSLDKDAFRANVWPSLRKKKALSSPTASDSRRPSCSAAKERQIQSNVTMEARVWTESTNILLKKRINKILGPNPLGCSTGRRSQSRVVLRLQYVEFLSTITGGLNAQRGGNW